MIPAEEAVKIITVRVSALKDSETVDLIHAGGRALATSIAAPLPLPPFTNSAVDGWA